MREIKELKRRLHALEAKLKHSDVTIVMKDGTKRILRGGEKQFFALLDGVCGRTNSEAVAEQVAWLRDAVEFEEQDGHLFGLLAAISRSQISDESEEEG